MSGSDPVLCVDLGTHAVRAVVVDGAGRTLAAARRPLELHRPAPDRVEQSAGGVLEAARSAVAEAVAAADRPVAAAGIASQRSSIVAWRRSDGRALTPVISWMDRRAPLPAAGDGDRVDRLRRITGLRASPHYGAPKIRWCLDHEPAVAEVAREGDLVIAPVASWLVHGLCEERPVVADPANASRTLLWDRFAGDWSAELLDRFGIPEAVLPDCVPTRHSFGHLRAVGESVPLTIVTGDQSAAFDCRENGPGEVLINLGTGAFLQMPVETPPENPAPLLTSVVFRGESGATRSVLEATINGAASALDEIAEADGSTWSAMHEAVRARLTEAGDLPVFLNGVGGLAAPWWRPDFASRFVGQADPAGRLAAVVESITFLIAENMTWLERLGTTPVERLFLAGGLARFGPLAARLAQLTGTEVAVADEPEITVHGLARLVSGKRVPAMTFHPVSPSHVPGLGGRFGEWRRAMESALAD